MGTHCRISILGSEFATDSHECSMHLGQVTVSGSDTHTSGCTAAGDALSAGVAGVQV